MKVKEITINTPFIVYGAGEKGRIYLSTLEQLGYKVLCYMDRGITGKRDGLDIYNMHDTFFSDEIKQESVVVVTVLNAFTHEDIARELYQAGFKYILFKSGLLRKKNLKEQYLNRLYDGLYPYNTWKDNQILPDYELIYDNNEQSEFDYSIDESELVCCNVPIEYIGSEHLDRLEEYGLNFDEEMKILFDRSVLWFLYCGDLYQAFQGQLDIEEGKRLISWYRSFYIKTNTTLDTEKADFLFEKHLKGRFQVYELMEYAYNCFFDFFDENRPYVKLNSNGFFNISEGKNRTAFLMSHGMRDIPCIMSREDYNDWQDGRIVEPKEEDRFFLKSFVKYLYDLGIEISDLDIYNMTGSDYYTEFFARFGAVVVKKAEASKKDNTRTKVIFRDFEEGIESTSIQSIQADEMLVCINIPMNGLEELRLRSGEEMRVLGTILCNRGMRSIVSIG